MPKALDLTGKRFGRLLVIKKGMPVKYGETHSKTTWICNCDCGSTEVQVVTGSLRNGATTSCGCIKKEDDRQRAIENDAYVGRVYPYFQVLRRDFRDFRRYICKCCCGSEFSISVANINHQKTCSCKTGASTTAIDLTGKKYARLTAIRPTSKTDRGQIIWEFRCDCGSIKELVGSRVSQGVTSSCGCLFTEYVRKFNKERFDALNERLIGGSFGRLTVVSYLKTTGSGAKTRRHYLCECDCGSTTTATASALLTKGKRSCGCLPRGTETYAQYLMSSDIAERDSCLYYVEVKNSYHKIGIAIDLSKRSGGDYTNILYERWMSRAEARGVEIVALKWTSSFAPSNLSDYWLHWGGFSELREPMDKQPVIDMLDMLSEECLELGWKDFWRKYGLVAVGEETMLP